ncbi:MAG: hypothetical protein ACRDO4_13270, partial [Nocardioides sp.]
MVSEATRLIPRWYAVVVVGALVVLTLLFLGLALTSEGVAGASAWGLTLATGLLLTAAISALARRRRPREPTVTTDGARVFLAPALTAWTLVGAWLALLAVAALWVVQAVTDFDALESPGFALLTILG